MCPDSAFAQGELDRTTIFGPILMLSGLIAFAMNLPWALDILFEPERHSSADVKRVVPRLAAALIALSASGVI